MSSLPPCPAVPVSWGELLDKITILEIKRDRIAAPDKRANVLRELGALARVAAAVEGVGGLAALVFRLTGFASSYVPDREVLVADKRTTIARARAELGYDPRGSVDDAVRAMVDGFVAAGELPARRLA